MKLYRIPDTDCCFKRVDADEGEYRFDQFFLNDGLDSGFRSYAGKLENEQVFIERNNLVEFKDYEEEYEKYIIEQEKK